MKAYIHDVTFSTTEKLFGDKRVEIYIDEKFAGNMVKAEDGAEWYTYGEDDLHLYENDLGTNLKEAKKSIVWMIEEAHKCTTCRGTMNAEIDIERRRHYECIS